MYVVVDCAIEKYFSLHSSICHVFDAFLLLLTLLASILRFKTRHLPRKSPFIVNRP